MSEEQTLRTKLQEARKYLSDHIGSFQPQILLVLGSGLSHVAEQGENSIIVPLASVPYMYEPSLKEQRGQFIFGTLGGKNLIAMQGRLHAYEGYTAQDIAFPVWLAHELGARVLVSTNAAGAIDTRLSPGDFCVVSDHINLTGHNPIAGAQTQELVPRFFSMEGAYDTALRKTALQAAAETGIYAQEGVYLSTLGPSFETPAEIRAFAQLGASTVAMSMCEEVIAARQMDMRVLGLNLIVNHAAGLAPADPNSERNLEEAVAPFFTRMEQNGTKLITGIIAALEL